MRRMGLCIGLKAEAIAEYKRVHAAVWPDVLEVISRANIRNYSIFLREPGNLLFRLLGVSRQRFLPGCRANGRVAYGGRDAENVTGAENQAAESAARGVVIDLAEMGNRRRALFGEERRGSEAVKPWIVGATLW